MGYKSINTKPSCNLWVILIFPPAVLCVWLTIKLRYRSKCGNVNLQICFVIKFHKLKVAWRIYLIAHASWPVDEFVMCKDDPQYYTQYIWNMLHCTNSMYVVWFVYFYPVTIYFTSYCHFDKLKYRVAQKNVYTFDMKNE